MKLKIFVGFLCVAYVIILVFLMPEVLRVALQKHGYDKLLFIIAIVTFSLTKGNFMKNVKYRNSIFAILDLFSFCIIQEGVAKLIDNQLVSVLFSLIVGIMFGYLMYREYYTGIKKEFSSEVSLDGQKNMTYESLNEIQKKAFDAYKNSSEIMSGKSFAYDINKILLEDEVVPVEYKGYLKGLDELSELYSLPNDKILYRACFEDTVKGLLDRENTINKYPAFMSTSTSKNNLSTHYAAGYNAIPCFLIIICTAGAKVIPLEKNDTANQEEEILLPRNSQFRLLCNFQIVDKNKINELAGSFHGQKFSAIGVYVLKLIE
ncbi:TPA: hypothetical protein RG675_002380 [Proteus mirabilis]|nr:hypothetical protein [Proteus mirabilis]